MEIDFIFQWATVIDYRLPNLKQQHCYSEIAVAQH